MLIEEQAIAMSEELIQIRHALHQVPEIESKEFKTIRFIEDKLKEYGIQYRYVTETSIEALICGKQPGKTILLRADIDALPIDEETDLPFRSKHCGMMHACGHDIHVTCLLGAAKILKATEKELLGNIKLIFQHAEEGEGGALPMIQQGVMENPVVDAALALHVEPLEDTGKIQIRNGSIMASPDNFYVTIKGKGGHGAYPQECIDPIAVGAMVVSAYQNITSRLMDPMTPCVVSVCEFKAGTCPNAIPDSAYISGTARSLDPKTRKQLSYLLEKIAHDIASSMGAEIEYRFEALYPPLINDSGMNQLLIDACKKLDCVKNVVHLERPSMAGDDFSYFAERVPSAYFKLGVGMTEKSQRYAIHSPKFMADESAFSIGAAVLAQTAVEYLTNNKENEKY